MSISFRLPALISVAALAVSCGGGSSSSSTIPRDQACAQASQAACAKVFACPTSDPIVVALQANVGNTEAACRTTIQQMYCSAFECATAAEYHGDKAGQCKQQFTDVTCMALSTAALSAFAGGLPALLASFPGCGQICSTNDAGAGSGG